MSQLPADDPYGLEGEAVQAEADSAVSPKVAAAGLAAAATTIIVWLVGLIFHVDVPALVAGALTTVIGVGAGYVKADPLRALGASFLRSSTGRHEA